VANLSVRPTIHIYPLSRLVNAPAGSWVRLMRQIEEGKRNAFSYYLPMREAVVQYCAKSGKDFDRILAQMTRRATEIPCSPNQDICADNDRAFRSFADDFYPRVAKFKRDLLRDTQTGIVFEGVTVLGAPHFVAQDEDGNTRYVFLYASNWSPDELKTYLQLLAIIVEKRFAGTAGDIWCMDLRRGKDIKFKASVRVLSRCSDAAKLYAQLAKP
jgi:hypothetical protein